MLQATLMAPQMEALDNWRFAVLAQYNSNGVLMQIALKDNLGAANYLEPSGIAVDRAGNVYTTVDTYNFDFMTGISKNDSFLRIYSYS